jgi:hypothetical protein
LSFSAGKHEQQHPFSHVFAYQVIGTSIILLLPRLHDINVMTITISQKAVQIPSTGPTDMKQAKCLLALHASGADRRTMCGCEDHPKTTSINGGGKPEKNEDERTVGFA